MGHILLQQVCWTLFMRNCLHLVHGAEAQAHKMDGVEIIYFACLGLWIEWYLSVKLLMLYLD